MLGIVRCISIFAKKRWCFVAAVNGNADVARILIKNDANINAIDVDGKTPLMIAVINGHQKLVELLLKNDADLNIKNAVSSSSTANLFRF